ncbi:hypothetical protein FB451DRAFT_1299031, partial [Mycena latifolia]
TAPRATYKFVALVLVAFVVLSGFAYNTLSARSPLHNVDYTPPPSEPEILALNHPTFADIRQYERTLPQHCMPTFMTKTRPRYVYFPGPNWVSPVTCPDGGRLTGRIHGWNNVFQEQLLNTHLACLANRGHVFPDYIARDHPPPRAASFEWWTAACPPAQVLEIQMGDAVRELKITDGSCAAAKLRDLEAECVRVVGGLPFDYMFIGSDKVISMWPSYAHWPTLNECAWSALITRALSRNFALFSAGDKPVALAPFLSRITTTPGAGSIVAPYPLTAFAPLRASAPPIPGLLGLHVRRGDYAEHCNNLVDWGSDYNAWNLFGRPDIRAVGRYPLLPDHLSVPDGTGEAFPAQALRNVFIATNGKPEWVRTLEALLKADG